MWSDILLFKVKKMYKEIQQEIIERKQTLLLDKGHILDNSVEQLHSLKTLLLFSLTISAYGNFCMVGEILQHPQMAKRTQSSNIQFIHRVSA